MKDMKMSNHQDLWFLLATSSNSSLRKQKQTGQNISFTRGCFSRTSSADRQLRVIYHLYCRELLLCCDAFYRFIAEMSERSLPCFQCLHTLERDAQRVVTPATLRLNALARLPHLHGFIGAYGHCLLAAVDKFFR